MLRKVTRILMLTILAVAINCPFWTSQAGAFSVDVKNLYYSDPSGPRLIDYNFSDGTVGDGTPATGMPVNSIGIPAGFILQKHSADLAFMFGNITEMGVATVTLNKTSAVATVATTQGGAILQGSSAPPPPTPATSWTYALKLQNFSGVTDAAKEYRFKIGSSAPVAAGPQPEIRGVWSASGTLTLQARIQDDAGEGTTLWPGSVVTLNGLTPAATVIELKIVNNPPANPGKVIFSYSLNGGAETTLGTYTISGVVFNSLPVRFPYLYMEERVPESLFQVSSQHWKDVNNNDVYNAWARVMDPGQALYSAVSMNSPGYLSETPLEFNSGAGYWSLGGTLFSDNFNDNSIDTAKWLVNGTSVTETGGEFHVDQVVADMGGEALSKTIIINPYAPITVQRKAKVHYANAYFDGVFSLIFKDTPDFAPVITDYYGHPHVNWSDNTMAVVVSHANYESDAFSTAPAHGFYLGRYPSRFPNDIATTSAIWDTWFDEKIVYNPLTGVAKLYIDGVEKATINVGTLPAGARYLKVYLDTWGWYTGHYNYSDDLTVSQPWAGGNVFLSNNTPPAGDVVFNFTATKQGGGTESVSKTIPAATGYVTAFATDLLPTGNVSGTPTFSWTGVPGATSSTFYSVQVSDATGNRIWNKYGIPYTTTQAVYNDDGTGPALQNDQTYNYEIVTSVVTGGINNDSFAKGSFTYKGTGGAASGANLVLAYPGGHPPYGFDFATGQVAAADVAPGDFLITGYAGIAMPYSAYGFLSSGRLLLDLGVMTVEGFDAITSVPTSGYTAPPDALYLEQGHAYAFSGLANGAFGALLVRSVGVDGQAVTMVFDYKYWGTAPPTIAFDGWAKAMPGWPATDSATGVSGALVSAFQPGPTPPPVGTPATPDSATGAFSLTGIPADQPFFLTVQASPAYMPVLSKLMATDKNIQALIPFALFTPTQYSGFANTPNTGMILGRAVNTSTNPLTFIPGVTIVASPWTGSAPGTPFATVMTDADGAFMIKNITPGTVVHLKATLGGYVFGLNGESLVPVQANMISEDSFFASPTSVEVAHPDQAAIEARFNLAMARFNAGDFSDATGFGQYVSATFLDKGQNRTAFIADAAAEHAAHGDKTWMLQSITGSGENAVMTIIWNGTYVDTWYFRSEGGLWMLYGNQKRFDVWASSGHQMYPSASLPFWASMSVEDPSPASGLAISSVRVTGAGIEGGINLYHDTQSGRWHSWGIGPFETNLNPTWATAPALPLDYFFTINYTGGTESSEMQTYRIKTFVSAAPGQGSITPASGDTALRPLTFAWASAGPGYHYRIEVNDANNNRIWDSDDVTGTSVAYSGPTLGGGSYTFNLITEDGYGDMSMVQTPFQMPLLYPRTQVTSGTGVADDHPAWSPNGQKIAFTSNRSGVENIWVVNADGTGLTQLTTETGYRRAKYPSWSPDGTKISYIVHQMNSTLENWIDRSYLYTMNADGTGQAIRPLPPSASQNQADQFWEFEVKLTEWLSNTTVAFVSFGPVGGSYKLYRYDLSSNTVSEITPPGESNPMGTIYKLSWNATLGKLAFDRYPTGVQTITDAGANLQVLDIPTANQGQMMDMGRPTMPGWNPNGTKLAYVAWGMEDIGIFDLAAGTAIVDGTSASDTWPVWSPDGSRIAIVSDGHIWMLTIPEAPVVLKGDINNDSQVNLADAILALQVAAGMSPTVGTGGIRSDYVANSSQIDVNGDSRIGLQEVIYILQSVAGLSR